MPVPNSIVGTPPSQTGRLGDDDLGHRERGVRGHIQRRWRHVAGHQLRPERRHHRAVIGAQPGPRHPQRDPGGLAPLARQRPQPRVGGHAAARDGDGNAIAFPRGKYRDDTFDFSFSGLKTAVARWVETRREDGLPVPVADVAASFQEAVADVLTRKAVDACRAHGVAHLIVGGGVAANSRLRALAAERCEAAGIALRVPRPGLCTDNGAMVAALGAELVARDVPPSPLDVAADSALPVTEVVVA